MTDFVFQNSGGGGGGEGKTHIQIEHEGLGTCARIAISQDANNADQKIKWFLKVYKACKLLWKAYFQLSFFLKLLFRFIFYKFFDFHPSENESQTQKLIKQLFFPTLWSSCYNSTKYQVFICHSLRTSAILKCYHIFLNPTLVLR